MKIYLPGPVDCPNPERITAPGAPRFAFFAAVGTWSPSTAKLCKTCGDPGQNLVEPLLVEWEPSSDVIGDFSWDGPFGYVFIAKRPVAEFMKRNRFGYDCLRVDYPKPELARRRRLCVSSPYSGSELVWIECNVYLELDKQQSIVKLESQCATCGAIRHTFRYKGITIRGQDWHGEKMFRIRTNGKSAATFVTEEGRELLEREKFTNIAFSEAGEITLD